MYSFLVSAYVALGFPFSVFGGIVNGFQRMYLNGIVALVTAIVVAVVNVGVLLAGYGLVELVAATTAVRIGSYFAYALNAYRVFPGLRIRLGSFRWIRLKEVTGFSIFILLIDLANKVNYSTDTIVIGAFMGTTAVAVWAVAQRLIEIVQRITDQLNSVLFPVVVDSSTIQHLDRLQKILLQGTRLSLAMVIPLATGMALLSGPPGDGLGRARFRWKCSYYPYLKYCGGFARWECHIINDLEGIRTTPLAGKFEYHHGSQQSGSECIACAPLWACRCGDGHLNTVGRHIAISCFSRRLPAG